MILLHLKQLSSSITLHSVRNPPNEITYIKSVRITQNYSIYV
jgi:hypothetical protein